MEPIKWESCPVVAPSQLADSLVSQMVVEKMNFFGRLRLRLEEGPVCARGATEMIGLSTLEGVSRSLMYNGEADLDNKK